MKYQALFEVRNGSGLEMQYRVDFEANNDREALQQAPILGAAGGKLSGVCCIRICSECGREKEDWLKI